MQNFVALKAALQPLKLDQDTQQSTADVREYLRFYQLDNLPGLHNIGWILCDSRKLAVQCWRPASPVGTALVVHGYYDHVGLYGHLIRFLLEQDYAVLAFDLPGHGLSDGEPAAINSFDEYGAAIHTVIKTCKPHLPTPWIGCGQSTGCAALLNFLMSVSDQPLQKLILLAPLLRPHAWENSGRLAYFLLHRIIKKLPRHFHDNSHDADFVAFCRNTDPLQSRWLMVNWITAMKDWLDRFDAQKPLAISSLLVQGEQDTTVDWRYNIPHIQQKLPGAQLHYLGDARHHLANESAGIRDRLWHILKSYLEEQ